MSNNQQQDRPMGGRRRRRGRPRQGAPLQPRPSVPQPDCAICRKPIRHIYSAINYSVTDAPVHFDCVLAQLIQEEDLVGHERLCYLGGGSFGVLELKSRGNAIQIRKRIQYETPEKVPDWRKSLRT